MSPRPTDFEAERDAEIDRRIDDERLRDRLLEDADLVLACDLEARRRRELRELRANKRRRAR